MEKLDFVQCDETSYKMNFPSDSDLKILERFPYNESHHLEFKKEFPSKIDTILSSLCALLNTQEPSYLLFGIEEDNRTITGVSIESPSIIDQYLLKIDNIIHNGYIHGTDKFPIHPTSIICYAVDRGNQQSLFVVRITPEKGRTYQLNNGEIWYRLSASNYKVKGEEYYNRKTVESILDKRLTKIHQEIENLKMKFSMLK
jgi:predicted HTH transcriptional regulator